MTATNTENTGPLAGVLVLEVATNISGPFCGQLLGDLGAEVVKLEAITGDPLRYTTPHHKGESAQFAQWNRNKKSIAVDLKSPRGLAIGKALASTADVVLQNARPGVIDALGLGYEAVRADNPTVIYLATSGYGDSGPYKSQPAYDPVVQGLTGFMYVQGRDGPPEPVRGAMVDKMTAIFGALAVVSALLHRTVTGQGQKVNVNMLDAYSAFVLPEHMGPYTYVESHDTTSSVNVFHLLEASDGYLTGVIQQRQFAGACEAFERTDLMSDPRFATPTLIVVNQGELIRELSQATRNKTKAQLLELVLRHELSLAPVHTFEEYFEDPQVRHNQSYVDIPDPELGPTRLINRFADLTGSPARIYTRPSRLGEHTDDILRGLDFTEEMIKTAREDGIVA